MNHSAHRIRSDETEKPEDNQYDGNGIQHDVFPSDSCFSDACAIAGSGRSVRFRSLTTWLVTILVCLEEIPNNAKQHLR
jgi:hypothetical protein